MTVCDPAELAACESRFVFPDDGNVVAFALRDMTNIDALLKPMARIGSSAIVTRAKKLLRQR